MQDTGADDELPTAEDASTLFEQDTGAGVHASVYATCNGEVLLDLTVETPVSLCALCGESRAAAPIAYLDCPSAHWVHHACIIRNKAIRRCPHAWCGELVAHYTTSGMCAHALHVGWSTSPQRDCEPESPAEVGATTAAICASCDDRQVLMDFVIDADGEASHALVVPATAMRTFADLDVAARQRLCESVVEATSANMRVYRAEVSRQRRALECSGITVPASYGRCVDVCRAWATLSASVDSVVLRQEWRQAHPILGTRFLMHVFLEQRGERVDPTASQLWLYGSAHAPPRPFAIEPTGQAQQMLRLPSGAERRLTIADRITLEAAIAQLLLPLLRTPDVSGDDIHDADAITPIVQVVHGIWAKRDDFYVCNGARGSKARSLLRLAEAARDARVGLVVGGSRHSPMISRAARVAEHVGIACRFHVGRSNVLSAMEQDALDHGAKMCKHSDCPYLSVVLARAKKEADTRGWQYVPFGVDCEAHAREIARQVPPLPEFVKRIVVVVGSGMTLAGVLRGTASTMPILGVNVSARSVEGLLDRRAPSDWKTRVNFVNAPEEFSTLVSDTVWHGIPLDPQYEAKAVRFMRDGDLLWIVSRRAE